MRKIIVAAALAAAAYGYALPGDLLVISKEEVKADAAAGFYYLGACGSGFLYSGSAAAVGRAAPYRTLDRGAEAKDYFVVWAPDNVKLDPAAFAHLGFAARVSPSELLIGVEKGMGGAAAIRAVDYRTELWRLAPVTRVEWKAAAESPPTQKDPAIEAAITAITAETYGGYIQTLQDFRTRFTTTPGWDQSRDYIHSFLAMQNLGVTDYTFPCPATFGAYYPAVGGNLYLADRHAVVRRSRDGGGTWRHMWPGDIGMFYDMSWLDARTGFVAGAGGELAVTRDGGDTWDTSKRIPSDPLMIRTPLGCHFRNANLGWVGGTENSVRQGLPYTPSYTGFLYKTGDGGRTWARQPVESSFRPEAIAFFDNAHGWIANYNTSSNPTFKYTNDGGATWLACTDPIGTISTADIAPVGPASAWATNSGGLANGLYRTTDGVTWTTFDPGVPGSYHQIEFPDPLHGFAAGSAFITTSDGGTTWAQVPTPAGFDVSYMSFADATHGLVADSYGEFVALTGDGGRTWTEVTESAGIRAENVIGERKGVSKPDEIVIIGGHADTYSNERPWRCPGAEDNASGTAVMMAAARAFRNRNFTRTVRFMAFGDEEGGLNGSYAYAEYCAARGEKIVAVLNSDMVAHDEDNGARDDLTITYADTQTNNRWLYDYVVAVGALYGNNLTYDGNALGYGSDDRAFRSAGYAAVAASAGGEGAGGTNAYPYYHTANDLFSNLAPALAARFSRDYAATLAHLAGVAGSLPDPKRPEGPAQPFARPFAVYPNPYRVSLSAAGVHFVGLATPANVKVYDLAGRRVASWDVGASAGDECTWRPAAAGGGSLAAGVYLYVVEGDNQREVGKLAVVK